MTVDARDHAVLGELVGNVVMIRDRRVDAIAVERRAPLHPALIAAGADKGVPDELSGVRIEEGVDAALPAEPDDVTPVSVHPQPHDVRTRAADIPFLAVGLGARTRSPWRGWLPHARTQGSWPLHAVRPLRFAALQVERDDRLEKRSWLLTRFREAARAVAWHAVTLAGSVYGCPNVPYTSPAGQVDGRRRKHRGAGVAARDAAVVGKRVALPQDTAGLRVEGDDRAAEGGSRARRRRTRTRQ